MATKKPKKLYAIFKPNGDLASAPQPTRRMAWGAAALAGHIHLTDDTRRLRRQGYACAEVRIERVTPAKVRG